MVTHKIDRLRFGTAGIPISTVKRSTEEGIARVRQLKLENMELEFVRQINISKEKAPKIAEIAKKEDVILTAHGSYYINLNAQDKEIYHASMKRIIDAARILDECKGYSLTFHAAYYLGQEKETVYEKVRDTMKAITGGLKDEGNNIWIRPETTGKGTQFGTLHEILKLANDVENVMPCIDFSHIHARSNGKENGYEQFNGMLSDVEKYIGKEGLNNMHIHLSGIEYGEKGEKKHLILEESDFKYKELMKALKEFKAKGVIVCESPNIEEDALLMKNTFSKI